MRTVAIDVGNSGIRVAEFEIGTGGVDEARALLKSTRKYLYDSLPQEQFLPSVAREALSVRADGVVVGSVHEIGRALGALLRSDPKQRVVEFQRGDEFPIRSNLPELRAVGVDRLAAALAAWRQSNRRDAVVVELGTAITVDWIDAGGVFQGGAIVPGRWLGATALHEGTDRLPFVVPNTTQRLEVLPGKTTQDAIRSGLDVGWVGLVDALARALLAKAGSGAQLWIGGGDADWYAERTSLPHQKDAELVCRGLVVAMQQSTARPGNTG